jgi:glycosyltransferase involved in cell wall biosynthesis
MRVLHVIARMNVGGTATYLANLINGLEKLGIENLLVMGNVPKGEAEDSVVSTLKYQRVESLSRELSFIDDPKAQREIEAAIEAYAPDVIHTHTFKAGFLVRMKKRSTPVVHSFHGHHLYDPEFGFVKRNVLNFIERRLASRAIYLVTIGRRVRDELLSVGIGKSSQYVSIAPGISPLELVSDAQTRKKFGFGSDEVLVVWLGRFTEVKRPDRVIEIARLVPEARFVMAGGGEMLDELKKTAPSNVTFVGFQDKNEMWSIADVALCTSDSEGMPLALIEAQMAGVPVVSTDVGSVSEIVVDGVTGRLGSTRSDELAVKLREVIAEIGKSDAMSQTAKKRAFEEFSSEVMAHAHADLYRKVFDQGIR